MRPPEPTDRLLTDLSRRWAHAIRGTSYVPLNPRELRTYLDQLTRRLSAAVRAPEFDPVAVRAVGADMVRSHFTAPESLERSLAVLGEEMVGSDAAIVQERAIVVLAAFAAGYTDALRGRTLAEQQNITVAAIKAQREAEAARRASEDRFRALFSDAAVGIVISSVQGEIVEINRAMCEMLRCTPEEMRQWVLADFVHPDDVEGTWDIYAE